MSMDTISDNTSGGRARCAVGECAMQTPLVCAMFGCGRSTSDGAESAAVESAGCIDGPRSGSGIACADLLAKIEPLLADDAGAK